MAIIKASTWLNSDGLGVRFGLDEAKLGPVAGYRTDGPQRFIEVVIDNATAFNATDDYILDDKVSLPEGALIEEVKVGDVSTAFASSGGGTISVGTIDKDQASNLAATSLLNAATVAELVTGNTAAGDGSLVKTVLTKSVFLTLSVDTAVFQGGRGTIRIYYSIPKKGQSTDTLVYTKP